MATAPDRQQPKVPRIASDRQIDLIVGVIDQLARITRPKFDGLERIPEDGRFLLVGNHTTYGVLDVPFMVAALRKQHGLAVRSLGDHLHWRVPLWRRMLESVGAVRGTREATAELMRRGETILVFPGGAREVNKRRGEKYQLFWKSRLGFAHLAQTHSYPIVPFAAVGAEEMLDVLIDENTPVYKQLVALSKQVTGLPLPSLVRGVGPTPIPRPKQLSFWFGEPIDTTAGRYRGELGTRHLRDDVRHEVENGIERLLAEHNRDA
jgi:1-acyl-sn-glycerol-3-phosphate acyltransferase